MISTENKWMLFVDGENLTLQAQKLAPEHGTTLVEGEFWQKDRYIWVPGITPTYRMFLEGSGSPGLRIPYALEHTAIRCYYYTAVRGSEERVVAVKRQLRHIHFDPQVFKKIKNKSKGVDITLSRDMLSHAYGGHYDVAILFAGDGDYLPLIDEVKRQGKRVCVCYFEEEKAGLSGDLRVVADHFSPIDEFLFENWKRYYAAQQRRG